MPERGQVYKCELCGNIVEIISAQEPLIVCCGQNMQLLTENTTDAAQEKHVPVFEQHEDGVHVKVGSAAHPMTEAHYIQWIEIFTEDKMYRQELLPEQNPEACFPPIKGEFTVRAYCNLHGLWKA